MFESDLMPLLLLLLLLLPRRKLLRTAAATHDVFRWGGGVADEAAARLVCCDQGRDGRVNDRIPHRDGHAAPSPDDDMPRKKEAVEGKVGAIPRWI